MTKIVDTLLVAAMLMSSVPSLSGEPVLVPSPADGSRPTAPSPAPDALDSTALSAHASG